ncbi:MAG: ABATE domain-containing protein [Acidobacteriota bacterium]
MATADALAPFLYLGNHPAIDFVNTVIRRDDDLVDLLPEPPAFERWVAAAGLGSPPLNIDAQDFAEAKRLRKALRQLFVTWRRGEAPDASALDSLNRVLLWRRRAPTLTVQDGELRWMDEEHQISPRDVLLGLAEQAAQLLTRDDRQRLKACGNDDCVLLFWDTSRNLSRRWCSMATCGNRSKVSRHYRRHRGSGSESVG